MREYTQEYTCPQILKYRAPFAKHWNFQKKYPGNTNRANTRYEATEKASQAQS